MEQRSRQPLTFGVVTGQHQLTWPQLVEQWQFAEEVGFDLAVLFDHFTALYADPDGPCLEASTLLSALALKTSRIKIGVLVYGNTHRHPAIFAKEMVTIDHVSDGRLILGIGAGWNEREHRALSIPFPGAGERVEMLDEAIQVIRLLFKEKRTTFDGQYYQLKDAPFAPKPVQTHVPIMVGGNRPRMLKLIAKHADIWDSGSSPSGLREGLATIAGHCAEIGRDPGEIVPSVSMGADKLEHESGFANVVREYYAAGARQLLFDLPLTAAGLASTRRIATEAIPALRAELEGGSRWSGNPPRPITLVTFDLYDTLIELHPPRWERFHAALAKLGVRADLEAIRAADVIAEDYFTLENRAVADP